ncbi:hypothetical protein TB2_026962 [Malus domestica]
MRRRRASVSPVPSPAGETIVDNSGLIEARVRDLVDDLNGTSSVESQRAATFELRLLARNGMENRVVIANCGAIGFLVDLLQSADNGVQENAVTALLNLSIYGANKTAIANTANAIEHLVHVLETGSAEAKENSAATLYSLSVHEEDKSVRIGRSGAIRLLVDLLRSGTLRGRNDAASALFSLSNFRENKPRIVEAGAVKYLVELMNPAAGMVDKTVAILANLSTIPEGRTAIGQEGGIPGLVEVLELGSARGKENAVAALLQLCTDTNRYCNTLIRQGALPPLVALNQSGTPRAIQKMELCLYILQESTATRLGCNKEISASRCMTYLLYMRTTMKYALGIVKTISWGILIPVGAIVAMVARHLKNIKGADPTWFNVQRIPNAGPCWRGYATIIMSVINIMKGFNISELPKEWKTAYVALIIAPGGTEVVLELLKLWRFISRRNQAAEQ